MTESNSTPAEAPKKPTRRETVAKLRWAVENADPGTLAALRRWSGDSLPPPAFYHLTVGILDEDLADFAESKFRDDLDARWAVIASLMARAKGFLKEVPLGEAMAKAGVAEMRLLRLLEANEQQLPDLVRNVVHQLVQKGQSFDPNDVANLLLDREEQKVPRSRIARFYCRNESK